MLSGKNKKIKAAVLLAVIAVALLMLSSCGQKEKASDAKTGTDTAKQPAETQAQQNAGSTQEVTEEIKPEEIDQLDNELSTDNLDDIENDLNMLME